MKSVSIAFLLSLSLYSSAQLFGPENIIAGQTDYPTSIHAADLDGDDDMDVLSASSLGDKIAWYENDGSGNFSSEIVISSNADYASSVYSADLDGDGDMDVLSASSFDDKIAWYENDGSGNFSSEIVISSNATGAISVYSADIDGDGDMDVLSASFYVDKIAWYENDGSGNFSSEIVISSVADGARSVYSADIDGDGDMDVLSASSGDDKIAWYENLHGEGCTDSEACNFNEEAFIDNGSCCFGICGCTDPQSGSFNSEADCNDGSCTYRLNGAVFYDENENGDWDETEYGLPNQQVILEAYNWTSYTNDEGYFSFIGPGLGQYTAELVIGEEFPFVTTINPLVFEVIWDYPTAEILFGLSNEEPDFGICVDFYPPGNGYPCNDWVNHNICYRNEGNLPIDGIVEVEFDPLFQDYSEATPIDSVTSNKVYMSFENLLPGQMFFYDLGLLSPTVDHIGEFITSISRVYGFHEGEQVAYGEKELTVEMTCSYDPNDKQVFPSGYLDEHLILNETELEFLIRFQNTGNASATNVLVTDTIDESLDLETFMLMANSHSVQTTVKPDERVIQFFFENIMLPDSSANEPESHGLISYMIAPYPSLEPGTVLNNTGNIYFDNNPPIITNTTWSTIHECGGESVYTLESAVDCGGYEVEITPSYPWLDSVSLHVNDDEQIIGDPLLYSINAVGSYEFVLITSNPLCQEFSVFTHVVTNLPLFPCLGDFNCDGIRNTSDLLAFMGDFGCISNCDKDLDNDGIISVFDLSVFLGLVGDDCEE